MVGFANFTHQHDYRLGQTPFYQKGAMGQDPLKTFSVRSTQEYRANASRIRDMRFANSNELNADTALRSKREQKISSMYSGSKNPELLVGVHGKLNPQYSRSGGALSTGRPYIKMMKGKKKKKGGGRGGQVPFAAQGIPQAAGVVAAVDQSIQQAQAPVAEDGFGAGAGAGANTPAQSGIRNRFNHISPDGGGEDAEGWSPGEKDELYFNPEKSNDTNVTGRSKERQANVAEPLGGRQVEWNSDHGMLMESPGKSQ